MYLNTFFKHCCGIGSQIVSITVIPDLESLVVDPVVWFAEVCQQSSENLLTIDYFKSLGIRLPKHIMLLIM